MKPPALALLLRRPQTDRMSLARSIVPILGKISLPAVGNPNSLELSA